MMIARLWLLVAMAALGERTAALEESVYGKVKADDDEAPVALAQVGRAEEGVYPRLTDFGNEPEEAYNEVVSALSETAPAYTTSPQLNDYPPVEQTSSAVPPGYRKAPNVDGLTPNGRHIYHAPTPPLYPFLYRGYPYLYGYPFDFKYGYAYGHAFGTDEAFSCPADGRYYRDFGSFYNCQNGHYTVQFCAPGSRNGPPAHQGATAVFCDVNLVGSKRPLLLPH